MKRYLVKCLGTTGESDSRRIDKKRLTAAVAAVCFAAALIAIGCGGSDDRVGLGASSGTYFARLESDEGVLTRKMLLIK